MKMEMLEYYIFIAILGVVALVSVLLGFTLIGSPFQRQNETYDSKTIYSFRAIKSAVERHYSINDVLPTSLDQLTVDVETTNPKTKKVFEYHIFNQYSYKLCTDFYTSTYDQDDDEYDYYLSLDDDEYAHDKGYQCLTFDIDVDYKNPSYTPIPVDTYNSNNTSNTSNTSGASNTSNTSNTSDLVLPGDNTNLTIRERSEKMLESYIGEEEYESNYVFFDAVDCFDLSTGCYMRYKFLPGEKYGETIYTFSYTQSENTVNLVSNSINEVASCSKDSNNCNFTVTKEKLQGIAREYNLNEDSVQLVMYQRQVVASMSNCDPENAYGGKKIYVDLQDGSVLWEGQSTKCLGII